MVLYLSRVHKKSKKGGIHMWDDIFKRLFNQNRRIARKKNDKNSANDDENKSEDERWRALKIYLMQNHTIEDKVCQAQICIYQVCVCRSGSKSSLKQVIEGYKEKTGLTVLADNLRMIDNWKDNNRYLERHELTKEELKKEILRDKIDILAKGKGVGNGSAWNSEFRKIFKDIQKYIKQFDLSGKEKKEVDKIYDESSTLTGGKLTKDQIKFIFKLSKMHVLDMIRNSYWHEDKWHFKFLNEKYMKKPFLNKKNFSNLLREQFLAEQDLGTNNKFTKIYENISNAYECFFNIVNDFGNVSKANEDKVTKVLNYLKINDESFKSQGKVFGYDDSSFHYYFCFYKNELKILAKTSEDDLNAIYFELP